MKLNDAISKVARDLNLPNEVVRTAYYSFWEFIKVNIEKLPLKGDLTEKEFSELKTSFNVPSLGKFHVDYNRLVRIKENYKNGRDKDKED